MRLRRVGLNKEAGTSTAVWDDERERWVPLRAALARVGHETGELADGAADVVAFLARGERGRDEAAALLDRVADEDFSADFDAAPMTPYEPRALRAFSVYAGHQIQAGRALARRYMPAVMPVIAGYERLTGRTFPKLKPQPLFFEQPLFYMGNHLNFYADGDTLPWPSYCKDLDYELEIAAILVHSVRDATPSEGEAALGGFVVINDISARDTQWREYKDSPFGPVVKAKTFANAMGTEVVTADEVVPRIGDLAARVHVNGELWAAGSSAGAQHSFGDMVAHASKSEQLHAGELMASGTLTGCCGLEIDRWIKPGDEVALELEGVGTLANTIGKPGVWPGSPGERVAARAAAAAGR